MTVRHGATKTANGSIKFTICLYARFSSRPIPSSAARRSWRIRRIEFDCTSSNLRIFIRRRKYGDTMYAREYIHMRCCTPSRRAVVRGSKRTFLCTSKSNKKYAGVIGDKLTQFQILTITWYQRHCVSFFSLFEVATYCLWYIVRAIMKTMKIWNSIIKDVKLGRRRVIGWRNVKNIWRANGDSRTSLQFRVTDHVLSYFFAESSTFMNLRAEGEEGHEGLLACQPRRFCRGNLDDCRARKSDSSESGKAAVLRQGKPSNDVFHSEWWSTMSSFARPPSREEYHRCDVQEQEHFYQMGFGRSGLLMSAIRIINITSI